MFLRAKTATGLALPQRHCVSPRSSFLLLWKTIGHRGLACAAPCAAHGTESQASWSNMNKSMVLPVHNHERVQP